MKLKLNFLMVCFLASANVFLFAQTIPEERKIDWSMAGNKPPAFKNKVALDFVREGADPSGMVSNHEVLNELINEYEGFSIELFIPNGEYLFKEAILLPSYIEMLGENPDSTQLIFDLDSETDLIHVKGSKKELLLDLIEAPEFKDERIKVEDASLVSEGDWFRIEVNDESIMTSEWAYRSSGQIIQVESIEGQYLKLSSPIRRTYALENSPVIQALDMKENVVISSLSIVNNKTTESQTSNIEFDFAYNSKVSCIKSKRCNFAHVEISNSSNIEVLGSYFNDAFDFGGGGKAYGVSLQYTSGLCLIENNTFERLRHSVLLQAGANGNVIAYNYSIDPFWTSTNLPSNSAGDLVLHGNYPYANLFEGNHAQQIIIDNSHGLNGPMNAFFRNRLALYGIFMSHPSGSQTFVGNEVNNEGFLLGNYALQGEDHFEYGNNVKGDYLPKGTGIPSEESLYLKESPPFYLENSAWPPIGPPNEIDQHPIFSFLRYESALLTACSEGDLINEIANLSAEKSFLVSPNPGVDQVTIQGDLLRWEVYSARGRLLKTGEQASVPIRDLEDGLIYLVIYGKSGNFKTEKIINLSH